MRLFLAANEACGDSVLCSARRRGELDNGSVSDPTSEERAFYHDVCRTTQAALG